MDSVTPTLYIELFRLKVLNSLINMQTPFLLAVSRDFGSRTALLEFTWSLLVFRC